MNEIILHSNNCPRCRILEDKLNSKNVKFQKHFDAAHLREQGFMTAPVLQVGDKYMAFVEANDYINEMEVQQL